MTVMYYELHKVSLAERVSLDAGIQKSFTDAYATILEKYSPNSLVHEVVSGETSFRDEIDKYIKGDTGREAELDEVLDLSFRTVSYTKGTLGYASGAAGLAGVSLLFITALNHRDGIKIGRREFLKDLRLLVCMGAVPGGVMGASCTSLNLHELESRAVELDDIVKRTYANAC